jgi:hypothetical protein
VRSICLGVDALASTIERGNVPAATVLADAQGEYNRAMMFLAPSGRPGDLRLLRVMTAWQLALSRSPTFGTLSPSAITTTSWRSLTAACTARGVPMPADRAAQAGVPAGPTS